MSQPSGLQPPTWWLWAAYRLERLLSRGAASQVGLVAAAALAMVAAAAGILVGAGLWAPEQRNHQLSEALWLAMAHALDGGTMGNDPPHWPYRLLMLSVTLMGFMLTSILVGLVAARVVAQLEALRRGRTPVLEEHHVLILGWSPSIFTIVRELAISGADRNRNAIVILADRDKVEMESEIAHKVSNLGHTRVICRRGAPSDLDDLRIVNPNGSRSIIILAPDIDDADTQVLKTILALTNAPDRRPEPYHIVAELREARKRAVAQLVGKGEVEVVLASEVITRLTVQTCFQRGLSIVYTELFDFDGDEIYLHEEPSLAGRPFGEAVMRYRRSSVLGLLLPDGSIHLNPPAEDLVPVGAKLFVVAADAKSSRLEGQRMAIDEGAMVLKPHATSSAPRRTLILAWNPRVPAIIKEMDHYVSEGSEVVIVSEWVEPKEILASLRPLLRNQRVAYWRGDTTDRRTLEALDLYTFHHIIVVGYGEPLDPEAADARTLVSLLYLRAILEESKASPNVVTEMLKVRNRDLAKVTPVDDFIVSTKLVSLILAQIAENKHLNAVFDDLLDAEGKELYLKPASAYVQLGVEVSYATVVESALRRGELALGYRRLDANHRNSPMDGVVVNPDKLQRLAFGEADRIIVLAED